MSEIRIAGKTLEEIRDYREVWFLCDLDETAMEIAEEIFENILPALVEVVGKAARYQKAKIAKTLCMQEHFRQLCSRCKQYDEVCTIYDEYVNAWIELDQALKGGKDGQR